MQRKCWKVVNGNSNNTVDLPWLLWTWMNSALKRLTHPRDQQMWNNTTTCRIKLDLNVARPLVNCFLLQSHAVQISCTWWWSLASTLTILTKSTTVPLKMLFAMFASQSPMAFTTGRHNLKTSFHSNSFQSYLKKHVRSTTQHITLHSCQHTLTPIGLET